MTYRPAAGFAAGKKWPDGVTCALITWVPANLPSPGWVELLCIANAFGPAWLRHNVLGSLATSPKPKTTFCHVFLAR